MEESTAWVCGFALLVVLILGSVFFGTRHMEKVQKMFINGGYEQVILPGSSCHKWQKAN